MHKDTRSQGKSVGLMADGRRARIIILAGLEADFDRTGKIRDLSSELCRM
jgi:hypothetical protein